MTRLISVSRERRKTKASAIRATETHRTGLDELAIQGHRPALGPSIGLGRARPGEHRSVRQQAQPFGRSAMSSANRSAFGGLDGDGHGADRRHLRPRTTSALIAAAATVSDLTAPLIVGLDGRPYRELLDRENVPHAHIGKRVVARLEHVLEAIDRIAARTEHAKPLEATPEPARTADDVLARIGRVRRAPER